MVPAPASGTDIGYEGPSHTKKGMVTKVFGNAFQVTCVEVLLAQPSLVMVYEIVVVPGPEVVTSPEELTVMAGLLLAQTPPAAPLVLSWVVV